MKKSMALSLLLAGVGSCMAQTGGTSLLPPGTDPKILACHEWASRIINASGQTAKYGTAGITERVIAESAYRDLDQTELRDTTRYFYSANAGSTYNFNSLDYSSEYNIMFGQSDIIFNDYFRLGVEMDSFVFYNGLPGLTSPDKKVKVVYDADGDILEYKTEQYDTALPVYVHHFINTYNVQGRLRESLQLRYIDTQTDTVNRKYFGYNAQGLLVTDSLLIYNNNGWQPRYRERITYNSSGQATRVDEEIWVVASGTWKDWESHQLSYYSDGKLKELASGSYVGTTFKPIYKDSLTYAPGCNFFLSRHISIALTGTIPEPVIRYTRHLNAQQLPDTTIELSKSASGIWNVDRKYLMSYNNNNSPVRKITQNGDGYTMLMEHYYYELYDDPTAIDASVRANDMRIYPNPASSKLCMEWDGVKQGQRVSVVLYNLAGQIAYSSDLLWKGAMQCLNIAGLRPGLYHLSVRDAQGHLLHTQRIVKQ